MEGYKCDNCDEFSASRTGWFVVYTYNLVSEDNRRGFMDAKEAREHEIPFLEGSYCSIKCLAEGTYAVAVLAEAESGINQ